MRSAQVWISRHAAPVLLLWLICALAGCASATVELAGWYVTRQIDGYVDLRDGQKDQVRTRVDRLLTELRREELPKALYLMRQVRDAIAQNQVEARIDELQARSDALLERAAGRLIPELAWLLSTMDDTQILHLEHKLEERVDEMHAEQALPARERRKELDEQLVDGLEKALGDLSDHQKTKLLGVAHALPDEHEARYRTDRARVRATSLWLRSHPGRAAIETELRRLWDTRYDLGPGRNKLTRRVEQRTFLLAVNRTVTPEQRSHAVERLNDQIRSLVRFELQ